MANRHQAALAITDGACNPCGIALALRRSCEECIAEKIGQQDDPAVRLIVSQLAYICGIWDGVSDFARKPDFHECTRECEKKTEAANV